MFRGYLAGGLWGLVLSALGLGTASLVAEQPAGNDPPERPVVQSPEAGSSGDATDVAGVVPDAPLDAGGAPAPSDTPEVTQPEDTATGVVTDTTPLEQPEAGEVTSGLSAPGLSGEPEVTVSTEEPVLPNPQAVVPVVPGQEADIVLETTTPAPPEADDVIIVEEADVPQADTGEDVVVVIEPEIADAAETVDEPTEAAIADEVVGSDADETAEVAAPEATETEAESEAETLAVAEESTPSTDDVAALSEPDAVDDTTDTTPALVAPEVDGTLPVTPSADDEDSGPRIALQGDTSSLPGDGAVRIIPSEDETVSADAEPEETTTEAAVEPDTANALAAFAAPFENSENLPLMAVILIDDGSLPGSEAALSELGFAVTVALNPGADGAADKMAGYRDAGMEVIALAEVPDGALPTDAEVALQAAFVALPEAIGLLDLGQAGVQNDRALAATAMDRLASDGRGFVTLNQGLNGGLRAATEAGVPAVTLYRDLDADGQDARVIRRFLDQAAFRARQQGNVALVARVRPDTISALVLWHTANRDGQVTLAPASAVLTSE